MNAPDYPKSCLLQWLAANLPNPDRLIAALEGCTVYLDCHTLKIAAPSGQFRQTLKPIHRELIAAAAKFQAEPVHLELWDGDRLKTRFSSEDLILFLERIDKARD